MAVGFGKQVPQFHCSLTRSDASQPVADSSCGAIVALSETGGQDQYFLLLHSLGETDHVQAPKEMKVTSESPATAGDFNGYLCPAK
jgi:hypothetical protein